MDSKLIEKPNFVMELKKGVCINMNEQSFINRGWKIKQWKQL